MHFSFWDYSGFDSEHSGVCIFGSIRLGLIRRSLNDEFFGSDPTIATRNLNANTVDNVQVYEKKSEDPDAQQETVKVVNLKLKDDSKKGYFGKISGASDLNKFYENDVLINKFKKQQKMS